MTGVRTVTFPNVEVLRAGDWAAAAGDGLITDTDLASIVAASQDPEVDAAIVHIGHFDPRFDGEPSLGRLANLRINDAGVLVADQVDTPATIAPVLHKAWPRRSAECIRNFRTPSGKTYPMVMRGLGLLGVAKPAVKGLADVAGYFAEYVALAEAVVLEDERIEVRTIAADAPNHDPRDTSSTPTHGGAMPLIDELRSVLGLGADTDEAAVLAAAKALKDDAGAAETLLSEANTKLADANAKLTAAQAAGNADAVALTESFRADLARANEQIVALTESAAKRDRDSALDSAIADGRLTVAERAEWEQRLAGPHGAAFQIALSERPKTWVGTGSAEGSTVSTFGEGTFDASKFDDQIDWLFGRTKGA